MLALALGFAPSACKDNSKSDQPGAGEAKPDQPASDQPAANADEADRAKMNRAVFDALKPGGVYAIIDYHAEAGSKDRDVKTIHRIDAELLKAELTTDDYPQV